MLVELSQHTEVFSVFKDIYQLIDSTGAQIPDHPFLLKCYQILLDHLCSEPMNDMKEILVMVRTNWNLSTLAHNSM